MTDDLPGTPGDTPIMLAKLHDISNKAEAFAALERAMRILSDAMPARASLRQGLAFVFVAYVNALGRNVTMTDLRDSFSQLDNGAETVGQSLAKSFSLFIDEEGSGGLGWVKQEVDRADKRKKYLRLTASGADVANTFISHINTTDFHSDAISNQGQN